MRVLSSDQALQELMAGNKRYVVGKPIHPNQTAECRREAAKGQHPFATIITCSDSRVPPEIIFDQGIGDLFVVRVTGNIVDNVVIGSIEYAVEHLKVQLIVVLGHKRCGVVDTTVESGDAHQPYQLFD